ncbi:arginyltransferase [Salinispirillum sp. LH 10-3-1]|uniref:Aspartate/glutamate leucyltransferase n=1 Tax=Salinispirillum sp. LH 10-3-1 TaxID=2952525 RepID=A0AB38YB61_9GAMM
MTRLFKTSPHNCSYLNDRQAETLFIDPDATITPEMYEVLNLQGFRRSGSHFYRPDCTGCNECQSLRVLVNEYQPARRHRRMLKKADPVVRWQVTPVHYEEAYWQLYERYINERHRNGDMFPPAKEDFYRFLLQRSEFGFLLEARLEDELLLVAAVDQFSQGLSAVYTFFDPDHSDLSPGTLAILQLWRACKELKLPYLYLGYWLSSVPNMRYKADFQPAEIYQDDRWQRLIR